MDDLVERVSQQEPSGGPTKHKKGKMRAKFPEIIEHACRISYTFVKGKGRPIQISKWTRRLFAGLVITMAMLPAAARALRGVVGETTNFRDCMRQGLMQSTLSDLGVPHQAQSEYEEFPTSHSYHGHLHGNQAFYEAESYAHTLAYVGLVVGTTDGNISNGQGVFESDVASDLSNIQLTNDCIDCGEGQFNVRLKQKVWHRIRYSWTPGHELDDNYQPMNYYTEHRAWGDAEVRSLHIDYELTRSYMEITAPAASPSTIAPSTSSGGGYGTNTQWPVVVEVNGGAPEQQPAGWTASYDWASPFSLVLTSQFEANVTSSTFICGYSGGDEQWTFLCFGNCSLSIEDAAPPALESRRSSMVFEMEYATCIYISSIEVTTNCDGLQDRCPCLKHEQAFEGPSKP